jgi:acyl-[acyl-carrier-protein] desaturase
VARIAKDEERHQEFFDNLVAHCLGQHEDQTVGAINRRAFGFGVVGGDILEYRETKVRNVADAGIFASWGLSSNALLKRYISA